MLTTRAIIAQYLAAIESELRADATAKNQRIPGFRQEITDEGGKLYSAHYFKYLVHGRGPGKQSPPEAMLRFVQRNPHLLDDARTRWKYITEKGLAYIIGRKIGREGTDIYTGKRPGIDLEGAIEKPKEEFLARLAYQNAILVAGKIKEAVAA